MAAEILTYYMQLPLMLHKEKLDIAETKFEVPAGCPLQRDNFVILPDIGAPMRIIAIFYDAHRKAFVCMPDGGSEDVTRNMDDWLELHPTWYKADRPIAKPVNSCDLVCGDSTCHPDIDDEVYDDSENETYGVFGDDEFDDDFDDFRTFDDEET